MAGGTCSSCHCHKGLSHANPDLDLSQSLLTTRRPQMRMLHFSADDGFKEAVWFTDTDISPRDITKELIEEWDEGEWVFDWDLAVKGTSALPATETPYLKIF